MLKIYYLNNYSNKWSRIRGKKNIYKVITKKIKKESKNINQLNIYILPSIFFAKKDITNLIPETFIKECEKKQTPIIFTSIFDFFDITIIEDIEKMNDLVEQQRIKDEKDFIKKHIDPRYRFFDSCIWFRYIPLYKLKEGLQELVEEIEKWKENGDANNPLGLFASNGALEFREFQIRQFNESYIKRVGEDKGSHAGHIAPYGFHSETKMKIWADEEFKMIKGYKWNLLLIDDFANQKISKMAITKGNLIKKLITYHNEVELDVEINSVESIDFGLNELKTSNQINSIYLDDFDDNKKIDNIKILKFIEIKTENTNIKILNKIILKFDLPSNPSTLDKILCEFENENVEIDAKNLLTFNNNNSLTIEIEVEKLYNLFNSNKKNEYDFSALTKDCFKLIMKRVPEIECVKLDFEVKYDKNGLDVKIITFDKTKIAGLDGKKIKSIKFNNEESYDVIKVNQTKRNNYDIILLDYYFENSTDYGEELLYKLFNPEGDDETNENFDKDKLGPTGKYWIFPVSVYSNALGDKLRDKHITWYDDKWIISPGADPLNTPHLFKFKIYSFMRRQLEEFSIMYKDGDDKQLFSELEKCLFFVLFDFNNMEYEKVKIQEVKKIKTKLEKEEKPVPNYKEFTNKAINVFPTIVELGVKFKRLRFINNNFSKSVLKEFFFDLPHYDWERFQHMMYLIAYGNNSDNKTIWNEAANLKRTFNKINNKENHIFNFFLNNIIQYLSEQNK